MKRLLFYFLPFILWVFPFVGNAQITDLINAVKQKAVDVPLLGTKNLATEHLVGSWLYEEPEIVFESNNLASQLGGIMASGEIKRKITTGLSKVGFTSGSALVTFKKDGSYIAAINGQSVSGKYRLKGVQLILEGHHGTEVCINVKLIGKKMQLAVKGDKYLTLIKNLGTLPLETTGTLQTVSSLLKNYNGVQLGLVFRKK